MGFPGGSVVKYLPASARDTGDVDSILGSGRSPGEGNPLQYSCLEIPWTEEAGGLETTGLQRFRHVLVTEPPPFYNTEQL